MTRTTRLARTVATLAMAGMLAAGAGTAALDGYGNGGRPGGVELADPGQNIQKPGHRTVSVEPVGYAIGGKNGTGGGSGGTQATRAGYALGG